MRAMAEKKNMGKKIGNSVIKSPKYVNIFRSFNFTICKAIIKSAAATTPANIVIKRRVPTKHQNNKMCINFRFRFPHFH